VAATDEIALDFINSTLDAMLPEFMFEELHHLGYTSGLPPSGSRGYSTTGAVGTNYLAPQHYEPKTDPLWTLGTCFDRGDTDDDSYNIVMGGLENGKGLVGTNLVHSVHLWKAREILHSGTIGTNTFNPGKPVLGIAMYQKRLLLAKAQDQAMMFPQTYRMPDSRDERYNEHFLKWIL
jgi:hypothetical protein